MKFKQGHKKVGGRAKGTPNKESTSLIAICERMNFNPFEALVEIAKDKKHPKQFEALKEATQYVLPKRKSLEHSGSLDPKMMEAAEDLSQKTNEEKIAILKAEIEELKK